MSKKMILLVAFGGPRSETEIPLFLEKLTGKAPTPGMREGTTRRYAAIGGCSPLPDLAEELALLLSFLVHNDVTELKAAFLYSSPTIEEAITNCYRSRIGEIIFFVLSPFHNIKTTQACTRTAEESLAGLIDYRPVTRFVDSWFAHPLLTDWWARKLHDAAAFSHDVYFLFSAHAMPVCNENDLYRRQVEETVKIVVEKANVASHALAWQSVPQQSSEEWFGPSVEQTLDSLAQQGVKSVVQVPIGFILDNLETLYDIDIMHKTVAERLGIGHQRIPCPNVDPLFVQTLSGILSSYLKEAH